MRLPPSVIVNVALTLPCYTGQNTFPFRRGGAMKTEPVLTAGALTGILMAGLVTVVSLGWLRLDDIQLGNIEKFAATLLALLLPVLISLWPRSQVTPVSAPKTAQGEDAKLVPVDLVSPQVQSVMSERAARP